MVEELFADLGLDRKEGVISSGIEKLDRLMEGGIPVGFTTVLLGSPGSSIEILVKQIATVENVTYITTEETKDAYVQVADQYLVLNLLAIDLVLLPAPFHHNADRMPPLLVW